MRNNLNCPNCGHPILAEENKCPYCDTSYFDISAIDLSEEKPFYLKIKVKDSDGRSVIITQLVKPSFGKMTFSSNYTEARGWKCNKELTRWAEHPTITTGINFIAIPNKNDNLIVITEE